MKQAQTFYRDRVVGILTSFQLLELALKMYIGRSYELIGDLVKDKIHFDFSISDIESYPLERLLNLFAKLNANEELKKRLNKLRSERNYVAHEALIVSIGNNPNMDTLHKKAEEYFYLEDELAECLQLVVAEGKELVQRASAGNA